MLATLVTPTAPICRLDNLLIDMVCLSTQGFYMKKILLAMAVLVAPAMGEDEDEIGIGDFAGGVLGKSAIITGRNTAVTSDGKFICSNGRGFATSGGYYGANGKQVFGNGKLVVKSGSFFYGSSSCWKNGNSYFDGTKDSWVTGRQRISD